MLKNLSDGCSCIVTGERHHRFDLKQHAIERQSPHGEQGLHWQGLAKHLFYLAGQYPELPVVIIRSFRPESSGAAGGNGQAIATGATGVVLAAQGRGARSCDTKPSQKSAAWTTRIKEIPVAN